MPGVPRSNRAPFPTRLFFRVVLAGVCAQPALASAAECASRGGFSPCFDANALWLPAGRASFLSMPDTQLNPPKRIAFGVAGEVLHRPLVLHAASPDRDGRDVHVLDYALDVSYFVSFGFARNFELSALASTRAYQSGAGASGVTSQSAPPLQHNAVRDPRIGIAYSFADAFSSSGFGLRLGLDATLPIGDRSAFANERSFVAMPNATLGYRRSIVHLSAELGLKLRRAVDFGGVTLGNQGFVALGVAVDILPSGWLTLSAEAFGLPPLSSNRGRAASPLVSDVRLFPAEWLAGVHSSFGSSGVWTVSLAAGSGIPLSGETRANSLGSQTSQFMGPSTPDFRSLVVVRFAALEDH